MIVNCWKNKSVDKNPVLTNTLQRINWSYGKGEIKYVIFKGNFGNAFIWHGYAPVGTIRYETVKFSIVNNFVHFRGKKRKIGYVQRY